MKKILAFLAVIGFFLPQVSWAYFKDVPSQSPYYRAVEDLADRGILTRERENFMPSGTLTRAELAKVSLMSAGIKIEKATEVPFPDLTADWMNDVLFTAKKHGIVQGYFDGKYRPNNPVTYIEAFKIMQGALDDTIEDPTVDLYDDVKKSDWWARYVKRAEDRKLLPRTEGKIFDIHRPFPRSLMAQMLHRDLLIEDKMTSTYSSNLEEDENNTEDLDTIDENMDFELDLNFDL